MSLRAPPPDFRYVGLSTESPRGTAVWGLVAGGAVAAGVAASPLSLPLGQSVMAYVGVAAAVTLLARRAARRAVRSFFSGEDSAESLASARLALALVPWGVLVESRGGLRALRWAAVKNVEMTVVHGRDDLTPVTKFSQVRIDTSGGALVGYASGAAPLDRLVAHLGAYAGEQDCAIALDLDGDRPSGRVHETQVEPLLSAARSFLASGEGYAALALPSASYRTTWTRAASDDTIDILRAVLVGRDAEPYDRRPFAAVVAAELKATELIDELIALVDSPHPLVASVAKAAALRLGAPTSWVGSLDEIEAFLAPADLDALRLFAANR